MGFPQARNKKLRIAAIGAGASGLAALRIFADEFKKEMATGDCEMVCFERRGDSGGIWYAHMVSYCKLKFKKQYIGCLTVPIPYRNLISPTHLFIIA
jgi:cation diffusion facilitator CzcD-associated flavoprotein CzcO